MVTTRGPKACGRAEQGTGFCAVYPENERQLPGSEGGPCPLQEPRSCVIVQFLCVELPCRGCSKSHGVAHRRAPHFPRLFANSVDGLQAKSHPRSLGSRRPPPCVDCVTQWESLLPQLWRPACCDAGPFLTSWTLEARRSRAQARVWGHTAALSALPLAFCLPLCSGIPNSGLFPHFFFKFKILLCNQSYLSFIYLIMIC